MQVGLYRLLNQSDSTKAQIVVTDGKPFGADGFVRFSYATSLENLQKAVEKMSKLIG